MNIVLLSDNLYYAINAQRQMPVEFHDPRLVQAADQAETDSKGTSARKDFSVATKMQKPWIFS